MATTMRTTRHRMMTGAHTIDRERAREHVLALARSVMGETRDTRQASQNENKQRKRNSTYDIPTRKHIPTKCDSINRAQHSAVCERDASRCPSPAVRRIRASSRIHACAYTLHAWRASHSPFPKCADKNAKVIKMRTSVVNLRLGLRSLTI